MTVLYRGDVSVREVVGSPKLTFGVDEIVGVRVFRGLFEDLLQAVPDRGGEYKDLEVDGLRVNNVVLEGQPGGTGEMTVSLSNKIGGGDNSYSLEVDWGLLEKPLETHPMFKDVSEADRAMMDAWMKLGIKYNKRRQGGYAPRPEFNDPDPDNEAHWARMTALGLKFAKLKLKGVETHSIPAPIIRRTKLLSAYPATTACGKISAPPISIPGYVFLKTADRAVRDGSGGSWKRIEEWTGAEEWDTDLYA